MKEFTATQLNKSAQKVFSAAHEDGKVIIKHDRYPNILFSLTPIAVPREDPYPFDKLSKPDCKHDCDESMVCSYAGINALELI